MPFTSYNCFSFARVLAAMARLRLRPGAVRVVLLAMAALLAACAPAAEAVVSKKPGTGGSATPRPFEEAPEAGSKGEFSF